MAVTYEWDIEILDEHPSEDNEFDPDILDHDHCEKFAELMKRVKEFHRNKPHRIVLVRDVGNDVEGITDRDWAYLIGNELPDQFGEGHIVPKRFHDEVKRYFGG